MDKCIHSLVNAIVFSTFDANNGYRKIVIDETDCDKSAYNFNHKHNQFIPMLFKIRNASGTLQKTMDVILSAVKGCLAPVYIDDCIVF